MAMGPDYHRNWGYLRRYGMTLIQYNALLEGQGGVCAICKNPPKTLRLRVDHDHSCCPGEFTCGNCVRGLLCAYCNQAVEWEVRHQDRIASYLTRKEEMQP